MAPLTVKNKKTVHVSIAENGSQKKTVTEKKKRVLKTTKTNEQELTNDSVNDAVPPTKRGRKKATKSSVDELNPAEDAQNCDVKVNSNAEDAQKTPSGKKTRKFLEKGDAKPIQTRGRKAKQENPDVEEKVPTAKISKGKVHKVVPKGEETDNKTESVEEKVKSELAKGRKKASVKDPNKKTPESEDDSAQKPVDKKEGPKKKETKGRKGGKKANSKDEEDIEDKEKPAPKKQNANKEENTGKEKSPEPKLAKGKRGIKTAEASEETEPNTESSAKRRRKYAEPPVEVAKKVPAKNKATTAYEDIDFSNSSKNSQGKQWNFKISSWNVDGIRAWATKGGLDYIKYEKPNILCLQEIKCSKTKLPAEIANLPGYHAYWLCSEKDGYAGVGIYTTKQAMNVQYGLRNEELDSEGRIITAEYEHFYLICTYVPNAGRNLVTLPKRLHWNEEFRKHVKELDKKKPVIICGDMNVAHNEIDLANPKTNKKKAGFTNEERSGMTELLGEGFVDTYRHLNPDKKGAYTFWTYMSNSRAKNVGWRLDYFIVSERLLPIVCDNVIRDGVYGSDHCPLSLFLHLTTADKPKE